MDFHLCVVIVMFDNIIVQAHHVIDAFEHMDDELDSKISNHIVGVLASHSHTNIIYIIDSRHTRRLL